MRYVKGILIAAFVAAMWGPLYVYGATSVTMDGPMSDGNAAIGQANTANFNLNMDDHNIDYVAVQTVYSSGNYTSPSFNDGRASTASLNVVSYADLSTQAAHGTITVVTTGSLSGVVGSTSILVSSNAVGTIIRITGPPANVPNPITIGGNVAAGFSSTNTAANIGVFWSTTTTNSLFTTVVSGSSVTISCVSSGTFCNAYAITSSSTAISSATFVGGVQPASITVNGAILRANYEWQIGATSGTTATNIMNAINLYVGTNSAVAQTVIATNSFAVIAVTATVAGSAGNNITLGSFISSITTSGTSLLSGTDNAWFSVNGTSLVANRDFFPITSNAITASAIVTAWGNSVGSRTVTMGTTGTVIGATTTAVGTATTYTTITSSQGALALAPYTSSSALNGITTTGSMSGGLASSFTINTQTIRIPSHGLPTGLLVWLSSGSTSTNALYYSTAAIGAGGTATQLAYGATYYVIAVDANNISLTTMTVRTSPTLTMGLPVTFVSSAAPTTTDTYTLNVATAQFSGSASMAFWGGNDGNQFTQITSTSTLNWVFPSTSTFNDIGLYDYKWLQARVVAPISGAMPLKIIVHGEKR